MVETLLALRRWLHRIVHRYQPFAVAHCEEMPDAVEPFVLYLIGDDKHPWAAAFVCPCGCAQIISLSLITDDDPSWRLRRHRDGTVSVFPSVWRTKGCRSHFLLRANRVVWAREMRTRR